MASSVFRVRVIRSSACVHRFCARSGWTHRVWGCVVFIDNVARTCLSVLLIADKDGRCRELYMTLFMFLFALSKVAFVFRAEGGYNRPKTDFAG